MLDQVKAIANHSVLGKRLRGDAKKVAAAIAALTKAEIEKYQAEGHVELCGHKLTAADNDIEIAYTVSDRSAPNVCQGLLRARVRAVNTLFSGLLACIAIAPL